MSDDIDRSSRDDIIREAVLIDPPGGESLRLRFYGPFEGREVLWIATFHALGSDGRGGANFIHVGEETPEGMTLSVGLPVARIDLPTIRNAVIMIRRYKRLRRGRHEW